MLFDRRGETSEVLGVRRAANLLANSVASKAGLKKPWANSCLQFSTGIAWGGAVIQVRLE